MAVQTQSLFLDEKDSAATVLADTKAGMTVTLKGSDKTLCALNDIPYGHKIAVKEIAEKNPILKYGQKIGIATEAIKAGEWIHLHNMSSDLDVSFSERIDTCSKQQ